MKSLLKPLFILTILGLVCSKSFSQETVHTVQVTNLENVKGTLYIGWYDKADDFRINNKAVYRAEINVSYLSEVMAEFDNIPPGNYAIAVFLDEDGDYKLDRNLFGIPKEKYGFSNNVLPALRAATFKESVFALTEVSKNIVINLK